jgi:hypothetical protein
MSFVRILLPVILLALTHIYNYIFTCSEHSQQWKTSVVLPIPKVVNPSNFSDFRTISLQPIFSKVAEILMARQMTHDIRSNLEESQAAVLVLLDLSRVFDMVVHELLLCKMKSSYNQSDEANNNLLRSYFWVIVDSL